jgi:hypothetical protein
MPADLFDSQAPQIFFEFVDVSPIRDPIVNMLNSIAAGVCSRALLFGFATRVPTKCQGVSEPVGNLH